VVAPKVARATGLRWKYSTLLAFKVPSSSEYGRNAIATGLTLGRSPVTGDVHNMKKMPSCSARASAMAGHTRHCAARQSRLQRER